MEVRIIEVLRQTDRPLTVDEIAEKIGVPRKAVCNCMWKLVKDGVIKCFLREDGEKTKAVYIIL